MHSPITKMLIALMLNIEQFPGKILIIPGLHLVSVFIFIYTKMLFGIVKGYLVSDPNIAIRDVTPINIRYAVEHDNQMLIVLP